MKNGSYRSRSSAETRKFAEELAQKPLRNFLASLRRREAPKSASVRGKRALGAFVIALEGELGSGKTTFVQGFLRGLGSRRRTTSPTFILFRRFALRNSPFVNVYHIDAYRIKKPRELLALGLKEIFADPKNIVLVEWADKIKNLLPKNAIKIRFSHGKKEGERSLSLAALAIQ